MRRLLWFSLGYCAAAGLCALWRPGLWSVAAGLVLCGLAVLLFFLEKRERRLALAVLAAAGLGIGLLWCAGYRNLRLTPLEAVDGQEMEISLELCDYAKQTRYGGSVTGYAEVEGTRCKILLYTDEYEADWKPGDRVSLAAELRLTAEGGAREPTYHRTQGIFLLAYPRGEARLEPGEGIPVRYYPALWRRSLTRCVQQCFPEDTAGFVQGFLLGDKSDLSYEARNSLSLAGLSHLIAVSGLHISMLFGALYPLTAKRRFLSLLLGAPVLLAYAAVAGFTPSASRAAIMGILILLATALNREYDPPTALGFSALVLLAANPLAIASVSFQLSFAAVGGIFLFSSCIQRWCEKRLNGDKRPGFTKRLLRLCIATVSITLGAGAATTPLVAYYFGHISLLSPLTNFLCFWVVTVLFYLSALSGLLGLLWLPLGKLLGWTAAWGVRFILWIARKAAAFPLCAVYTDSVYVVVWLAAAYGLFFLLLLWRKRPGFFLSLASVALCAALLASWTEPLTDEMRVTVLDVGQGQCVLLQRGRHTLVVDCGGSDPEDSGEQAARRLLSMGIRRVDAVVFTHLDTDHAGGGAQLLSRIGADRVIVPAGEDPERVSAIEAAQGTGELLRLNRDLKMDFSGGQVRIFGTGSDNGGNEGCLAVLFTVGECDTLILGDMNMAQERTLIQRVDLPDAEILVVSHHGSQYGTAPELLKEISPETAVISVGSNSYGHPSGETVERLEFFGCQVYRTDQQGTILIRR